jgi:hypothetical protein
MIAQGVFTFAHCSLSFKVPDTKVPSPASGEGKGEGTAKEDKAFHDDILSEFNGIAVILCFKV